MPDPTFWSNQRVLLTGHTGFKGSWLTVWLRKLRARVFGFALEPATDPSLYRLLGRIELAGSMIADIRDREALNRAVDAADPTVVIHMAAQALVRRGYLAPVETFNTNVIGTANLLDALRGRRGLRTILVVTTDKVYCNPEDGRAFREDDPLGGQDPYSASKAAAEITAASWAQSYFAPSGIPVITARAGNVIGGGDWSEDRLVPDIWRASQSGETLVLRHPETTRPWQHVTEPLAGYLRYIEAAAQRSAPPSALNFGPEPGDVLNVAAIAAAMQRALGAKLGWSVAEDLGPAEMTSLALDSGLAAKTIGWRSRLRSSDAIAWTADWYGRLARGEDATSLCLEQLTRYEALQ